MNSEHIELLAVPVFPEISCELILLDRAGEIMDENEFKEFASRLEKIAKVLEKLPSEVRAAAFDLIKGYVAGHRSDSGGGKSEPKHDPLDAGDDAEFFGRFPHDKAADNAKLLAADHFSKYGSAPFSVEEINQRAAEVGITIPGRIDMTFRNALDKGHNLFVIRNGQIKPTVHGEQYLRSTYGVKKGTKPKPAPAKTET